MRGEREYLLYFSGKFFGGRPVGCRLVAQTDASVALPAIMFVLLSEVIQQHTAAAYGVVGYVVQYGIDTCFITGFPFFINFRRKVDALRFHTFARVRSEERRVGKECRL